MRRRLLVFGGLWCLAAAGCWFDGEQTPESFFRTPVPVGGLPPVTPAGTEAAARVDIVGRRVLAANPHIGAKPLFRTVGATHSEVFHRGTSDVFVTEGLVKQCQTDGQLAAVLALELGKLVAEREAKTPAATRSPDRPPPLDVRLGADDRSAGSPDQTHLAELAGYDEQLKAARRSATTPLNPNVLALNYLDRAGYLPEELAAVEPLLKSAAANTGLEKQITSGSKTAPTSEQEAR